MAYIYDLSDAWSAAGTTFTAIKMSVTDTASAAGSLLMDLQVGGVSRFRVTKSGILQNSTSNGVDLTISYNTILRSDNGPVAAATGYGFGVAPASAFAWNSGGFGSNGFDLALYRDAANTLAQRNGVNAQAFNLYNTYTDASNYERGFMRFVSNVLEIGSQAAGTGTARSMVFQTGGVTRFSVTSNLNEIVFNGEGRISRQTGFGGILFDSGNNITIGAGTSAINFGGYMQVTEMTAPAAPAANGVRIYAEDDGAGKTRLMARFATGAAQQIAIEP